MQNETSRSLMKWATVCTASVAIVGAILFGVHRVGAANTTTINGPLSGLLTTPETSATYNRLPLPNPAGAPPVVMLVVSRDEQLSVKAYTDYTDLLAGLPGDTGVVQTTYNNSVTYDGYFDPDDCYKYVSSGTNSPYYQAAALASTHQCTSAAPWSGNFMNWLTMSRMDIVRKVLFGGKRSVDIGTATGQQTVLQRAFIPDDVHSWAKVYPNTNNDINLYTPLNPGSGTAVSFCNTSSTNSAGAYANNSTSPNTGYVPWLRVAYGSYPNWASTEARQCDWSNDTNLTTNAVPADDPSSGATGSNTYSVYVDVCDTPGTQWQESFCRAYSYNGVTTYKPYGLLQQYGEAGILRFGLVTGSYDKPRSGGVLRRNVGLLANNSGNPASGCSAGTGVGDIDEVDLRYGTFCNQGAGTEGIINTLSRLQISQWYGLPNQKAVTNPSGGSYPYYIDCGNYGILNRDAPGGNGILNDPGTSINFSGASTYNCSDWGNPLAEMYAETLRYIANQTVSTSVATSIYQPTSSGIDNTLGLPIGLKWNPPYTTSNYCASCSIVLLSTGQTNFDSDELPATIASLPSTEPAGATKAIGSNEGYNGNNYLLGFYGSTPLQTSGNSGTKTSPSALDLTYQSLCNTTTVADVSLIRGVCPEVPALEGSYLLAGLAYDAWTNSGGATTGLIPNNPVGGSQKAETYAISLAESLPSLSIPLGSSVTSGSCVTGQPCITLAPVCQANNSGSATIDYTSTTTSGTKGTPLAGWRTCSFSNVIIGQQIGTYTYSSNASLLAGFSQKGGKATFGLPNVNVTYNGVTTSSPFGQNNSSGSITIVWDDSSWGNDHDLDQKSVISWCVGSACSNFLVGGTGSNKNQLLMCQNTDSDSPICSKTNNTPTVGANQMLVRVEDVYCNAGNSMLAGFTVSGSTSAAIGSGISGNANVYGNSFTGIDTTTGELSINGDGAQRLFLRPGNNNINLLTTAPSSAWSNPQVVLINAGTSQSAQLNNPLFYAAEYGGFTPYQGETGNTLLPTAISAGLGNNQDWDTVINASGNAGSDGIPDNYFEVHNPNQLSAQLQKVFNSIVKTTGSGTAAAVVANQREGDGATYQALYLTSRSDTGGRTATWLGILQALFLDGHGNLRESNSTTPTTLTDSDFTGSPAIQFTYNSTTGQTQFNEFNCDPTLSAPCNPNISSPKSLDSLVPIWNARVSLQQQSTGQVVTSNRAYGTIAGPGAGRYIFTFIDQNLNGAVDSGEQVPFLMSSFQGSSGNFYGMLNVSDATSAQNLINYIRGQDVTGSGLRNRTIDYSNTGATPLTYPLGDIVNSTPTVIGAPAEAFDLLYNDSSYGAFRSIYQDRRNVIYVGANDGMLHAFNGGFYTSSTNTFSLTGQNSEVKHPLGAELWAYVPFNLLPHLFWLPSPTYGHVFSFDGTPRAFDAHIFKDATACTALPATPGATQDCHPYGWGTVLVVGMNFGGGDLTLPLSSGSTSYLPEFSGFSTTPALTTSSTLTTHSAYVVLDVTNPEEPPVLLGEITGTNPLSTANAFGFTTSYPAGMAFSKPGYTTASPPTGDIWYFLFGNGPDSAPSASGFGSATSTRDASLYVYQLISGATPTVSNAAAFDFNSSSIALANTTSSFVGNPTAVDWNLDFIADNAYVGVANGSPGTPGGQLVRIDTNQSSTPSKWSISTLVTPQSSTTSTNGLPVLQTPSVTFDLNGNHWVYAGTGRLFVTADQASNEQQALFGVIDPLDGANPSQPYPSWATMTDVTSAVANATGANAGMITGVGSTALTEAQLESKIFTAPNKGSRGWKITLSASNSSLNNSAQRVLSSTALLGNVLFATAYTPNTTLCLAPGSSVLYGLNYLTGVANPSNPALGLNTGGNAYNNYISLGAGLAAAPSVHLDNTVGAGGQGQVTIVTQTSTSVISTTQAQVSSGVTNGEIDWRQTHPNTGP